MSTSHASVSDIASTDQVLREAVSLSGAGRFADAEPRFRAVIITQPSHGVALYGLAMARLRQGNAPAAESWLRRALCCQPGDSGIGVTLSNLLTSTGRGGEAVQLLRDLAVRRPEDAMVQRTLGHTLRLQNRVSEADRRLRLAIALAPAYADAYGNRGELMTGLGRMEVAIALLERAMALAPAAMVHWPLLSQTKRFRAGDPHLARMQALAARIDAFDPEGQIQLRFALGKALDDIGAYDEAFAHIESANRAKRQRVPYAEAPTLHLLDRLRTIFTPDLLAAKGGQGNPAATPVFVVGMPRSGSTLIAQILASHPDCASAGETTALGVALAAVAQTGRLGGFPDGVPGVAPEDLRAIAERYLPGLLAAVPDRAPLRIIDKMPANAYLVGLIHLMLPNAKIIHTMRDARDTCLSSYFQNYEAAQRHNHDLAELGRYWRAYEGLMAHWAAILPQGTLLQVRYEDVVADGEGQTRRLLAHCGLPWNAACLEFHKSEQLVLTASAGQVRQPLYKTSVGRWQAYAHHLGPLLDALS